MPLSRTLLFLEPMHVTRVDFVRIEHHQNNNKKQTT